MISSNELTIFFKLQQDVLDNEDSNNLVNHLLPKILVGFSSMSLNYEFICPIFFNKDYNIDQVFFAQENVSEGNNTAAQSIINFNAFLNKNNPYDKELFWGRVVIVSEIGTFIYPEYLKTSKTKSLILIPLLNAKKVIGVLILGSLKLKNEINNDELEITELISQLISLAFRLQDNHINLTKITQEVYKMNAQLHQLDKLKDDFVSVASHELRTPMTAIKSYLWMALHRSDVKLSEKMQRYLTRSYISTERLINLVSEMLNVSRIEAGRIEIIPKPFNVQDLISDVLGDVMAKAEERNVKIYLNKSPLPNIFADPDKLYQVILNILGNALKFTPPGGSITISFFTDGKVVESSFKDTGVGIGKDDISKLFQKFGKLESSYIASATSGGTGLGLFISKNLIELMKGRIWATSEGAGKGTTFTFSLPIATQEVLADASKYQRKIAGEVKHLEPVAI